MHDSSDGILAVLLDDRYDKYDTIRSTLEFATNWEQPQLSSFIRFEVGLVENEWENWMAK